jgi:hypothetical protein
MAGQEYLVEDYMLKLKGGDVFRNRQRRLMPKSL